MDTCRAGCNCSARINTLLVRIAEIEADLREIDGIGAERYRREEALTARITALEARLPPLTYFPPTVGAAAAAPFTVQGVGTAAPFPVLPWFNRP